MAETGYIALPSNNRGPGIILLHAWWGLNGFIRDFCDRLAAEGCVAYAPDLYHGEIATTIEEADTLSSNLDHKAAQEEIVEAATYLRDHPSVSQPALGLIGFSLGVMFGLQLVQNRPQDIAAAVLFYGAGEVQSTELRTAVLGHFAENDAYEDAEFISEMGDRLRAAGCDVTFHSYPGAGHWFFENDRSDAYHADAARLAWERTTAFLDGQLRP